MQSSGPENEREREDVDLSGFHLSQEPEFELIRLPDEIREQLGSVLQVATALLEKRRQSTDLIPFWPGRKYERSFDQFHSELEEQINARRVTRESLDLVGDAQEFFGLALMSALSDRLNCFYHQYLLPRSAVFSDKAKDLFHELRMALEYLKFCRINLGPILDRAEWENGYARLDSSSAFCLREALDLAAPELDESWHNPRAAAHEFKLPEVDAWERGGADGESALLQRALTELDGERLPGDYFRLLKDDAVALDTAFVAVFEETLDTLRSLGDDLHLSHLGRLPRKVGERFERLVEGADELISLFHFVYSDLSRYL